MTASLWKSGFVCILLTILTTTALPDTVILNDGKALVGTISSVTGNSVLVIRRNPALKSNRDLPEGCTFFMGSFIKCDYDYIRQVQLDISTMHSLFSWEALSRQVATHKLVEELLSPRPASDDPGQPVTSVPATSPAIDPLVGVWFKETANLSAFERLTITLRPDRTYTKESLMRMSAYGTGYIPAKHDGTWRAEGSTVILSGDGRYPGSTHDLSTFTKLR